MRRALLSIPWLAAAVFVAGCEDEANSPPDKLDGGSTQAHPDASSSAIDARTTMTDAPNPLRDSPSQVIDAHDDNDRPNDASPVSAATLIAQRLQVHFALVANVPKKADGSPDCPSDQAWGSCLKATIQIKNTGDAWNEKGWAIYYSSIRKVQSSDSSDFAVSHVNGDLTKIEPTAGFAGFGAGETKEISIKADYWMVSQTDVMPRFYVVSGTDSANITNTDTESLSAFVSPFTTPQQVLRNGNDHVPTATAQSRFLENASVTDRGALATASEILPSPRHLTLGAGTLDLSGGLTIHATGLRNNAVDSIKARLLQLGLKALDTGGVPVKVSVNVSDQAFAGKASREAYRLHINDSGVTIVGSDPAGAFFGLQTLVALLPPGKPTVPQLSIDYDAPRFPYRGLQLDLARNFPGLTQVLKVIDQMAAYKLNTLHLHLSDDEGWRLEIPGLPELTTVGARRCHDLTERRCLLPQLGSGASANTSGSGYLTHADFITLLRAATARHIEVIPEFDMPGHARAAIKSMQARNDLTYALHDPQDTSKYLSVQYYSDNAVNPCLDSSYAFVAKVMDEVQKMYAEADASLVTFHIGGDEVGAGAWTGSPICNALYKKDVTIKNSTDLPAYFLRRVNELAIARGLGLRGWSDNLKKQGPPAADGTPTRVFLRPQDDFKGNSISANWWSTLFWWDNSAYEMANLGYNVILTNPDFLYFDHPYEADPEERGYYWATRYANVRKVFSYMPGNLPANSQLSTDRYGDDYTAAVKTVAALTRPENVIGMEGALWSETVRTPEFVDIMVFPRLLALAERAWHRGDWEPTDGNLYSATIDAARLRDDWERFANVLGYKELPKLAKAGVLFRVEIPGARIVDGKLQANVAFPGLAIEYQDADNRWQTYDPTSLPSLSSTHVRAKASDGRVGRAIPVRP